MAEAKQDIDIRYSLELTEIEAIWLKMFLKDSKDLTFEFDNQEQAIIDIYNCMDDAGIADSVPADLLE